MAFGHVRNKRIAKLLRRAQDLGWTATLDGRGHIKVTSPEGQSFWVSTTANDAKTGHHYENTKASARRAGLDTRGL